MPPAMAAQAQVERTRLAWRRSGLTAAVVVALGARGLAMPGALLPRLGVLVGLSAILIALMLIVQRRIRELTALQSDPSHGDVRQRRHQPAIVALLVGALALVAVVDVLLMG